MQVHTYVRKFNIEWVAGEHWSYFASTRHIEPAKEIGAMLQSQGKAVRISEVHEGWRETEFLNPAQPKD